MEFSRQEYWSALPFPSPGDLPYPVIKPGSPALQTDYLPFVSPGKPTPHSDFPSSISLALISTWRSGPGIFLPSRIPLFCPTPLLLPFGYLFLDCCDRSPAISPPQPLPCPIVEMGNATAPGKQVRKKKGEREGSNTGKFSITWK